MSDLSEKVRTAFYTKTNVSALVDANNAAKLYGIYEGKAISDIPVVSGVQRAYGVFNIQAYEPIVYAFNDTQVLETFYYQLRVYAASQSLAESLVNLWVSTLGTSLTITGGTVERLWSVSGLPPTDRQQTDRYVWGRAALIGIAASNG